MNKILYIIFSLPCLFMTACDGNNEPEEISPMQFEQTDYTIQLGKGASIPFTGGGGVYELTASNPDVLGKFGIDVETCRLLINPAKTGESTLTVIDVKAESSVPLHIKVEDFYLSFRVDEITGTNTNLHIHVGDEIRFIRNADNTKPVKIFREDKLSHKQTAVAEGRFDILRSETNIFTMQMDLHSKSNEELEAFEYTLSGDAEYLAAFDRYFDYTWTNSIVSSRSQPVRQVIMILTDNFNGCRIITTLQP